MTNVDPNLRKAAVLLRSLDADTAAVMLGQLSSEEAATIRAAMRAVGQVDTGRASRCCGRASRCSSDEAILRRTRAMLSLRFRRRIASESYERRVASAEHVEVVLTTSKRFEFLENAPTHALVPHLGSRACSNDCRCAFAFAAGASGRVLAALPEKVQAETVERLSTLGETDPECVSVLERELEAWAAQSRRFAER